MVTQKEIKFSTHALDKIEMLKSHRVDIDKDFIINTVRNPDQIKSGYKERIIFESSLDKDHLLRVVIEESHDVLKVITLYPARKDRYEKS